MCVEDSQNMLEIFPGQTNGASCLIVVYMYGNTPWFLQSKRAVNSRFFSTKAWLRISSAAPIFIFPLPFVLFFFFSFKKKIKNHGIALIDCVFVDGRYAAYFKKFFEIYSNQ